MFRKHAKWVSYLHSESEKEIEEREAIDVTNDIMRQEESDRKR